MPAGTTLIAWGLWDHKEEDPEMVRRSETFSSPGQSVLEEAPSSLILGGGGLGQGRNTAVIAGRVCRKASSGSRSLQAASA